MEHVKVFVLAAGSSSRLGSPKQLVQYKGDYLINHVLNIVENAGFKNINAILGSEATSISKVIQKPNVKLIVNEFWKKGMSSSIVTAINNTLDDSIEGVLFLTCDQILLNEKVLMDIETKREKSKDKIIACDYGYGFGPPCFFPARFFSELKELTGDTGGKAIIKKNRNKVEWVPFPGGEKDIDYAEDVKGLL